VEKNSKSSEVGNKKAQNDGFYGRYLMFVDDQGSEGVVSQDAHRDDGENQKFDDTNEKTHVVVFARIDKIHVSWSVDDSSSSPLPADPKIAALR
jgi:hypothetical protein